MENINVIIYRMKVFVVLWLNNYYGINNDIFYK